jgi:hypothetical protein
MKVEFYGKVIRIGEWAWVERRSLVAFRIIPSTDIPTTPKLFIFLSSGATMVFDEFSTDVEAQEVVDTLLDWCRA